MTLANTNIPRSVVEMGREADSLIEKLYSDNTDDPAIVGQQEANQGAEGGDLAEGVDNSFGSESQSTTEHQEPVSDGIDHLLPENSAQDEGTLEYWKKLATTWESKYQTLAGKYNKEIAEQKHLFYTLQPENDQLKADKEKLEGEVRELTLQLESKAKELEQTNTNQGPDVQELLGNLGETYGEDLANAFSSLIQLSSTASSNQLENIIKQVEEVKTTVEAVKTESTATTQQANQRQQEEEKNAQVEWNAKVQKFSEMLKGIGIDFSKVDGDPLFHEWLGETPEGATNIRNEDLLAMFRSDDLQGAAGMYIQYLTESGTMRVNSNSTPPAAGGQSLPDLSQQVQVEGKAPITNELAPEAPKWSKEDINNFYLDCTKGRYTREEIAAKEAEIFAQLNGR
ncbi:hypothetical protein K1B37_000976 [Vibrio parahaemolyticus]|nr:hypothetical protein [Vibrio parahaemolyticus]